MSVDVSAEPPASRSSWDQRTGATGGLPEGGARDKAGSDDGAGARRSLGLPIGAGRVLRINHRIVMAVALALLAWAVAIGVVVTVIG